MQSWSKLLVVWLLAVLLPMQSIAAMIGHCGAGSVRSESGAEARIEQMQMPCAHLLKHHESAPNQKPGNQAAHEVGCSACCAVPAAQTGFDASALPVVATFPPVIDQFAQFVPPGLKRPPSSF